MGIWVQPGPGLELTSSWVDLGEGVPFVACGQGGSLSKGSSLLGLQQEADGLSEEDSSWGPV